MRRQRLLESAEGIRILAERLAKCPDVTKYDQLRESEAWTLAHAFSDLEEAFQAFLDEELPNLMEKDLTPSEICDLLLDIGEELRHVLYHIKDTRYYRYLYED